MKKDIFSSMKEQMTPDVSVEASLKYELEKRKRCSVYSELLRWGSTAVAVLTSAVLVFNLAMPAYAEKLPIIGDALCSLNELGNENRENGKTPSFLIKDEAVKEDYKLSVTYAECNGLDAKIKIKVEDLSNKIAPEAESISLSDAILEIEGMYLYPTDENPRLSRKGDGSFSGWATFNSAAVSAFLESGKEVEAILYCEELSAFVEGATFEESIEKYTYEFHEATELSVAVDKSGLSVEWLGIEKYGINLEYKISSEDRMDITFTVDDSVEYPSFFSIYTDSQAPSVISVSRAAEDKGKHVYQATFISDGGKDTLEDNLNGMLEKEESYYLEGMDFVVYSEATGEYYAFESEGEAE